LCLGGVRKVLRGGLRGRKVSRSGVGVEVSSVQTIA
jgi:hypothetical protein